MKTARIVTEAIALGAGSIALETRRGLNASLVMPALKMTAVDASFPCARRFPNADKDHSFHREDPNAITAIVAAVTHSVPPTMLEMQK